MRRHDSEQNAYPAFLRAVADTVWNLRGLDSRLTGLCHMQLLHRQAEGLGFGAEALRGEAIELLAAFPDLAARTEDVIWSGSAQMGMLGSQRILMQGCHAGAGMFDGPAGRQVRVRMMADIYAKDERISEIWAVRDTGAILRQLGLRVPDWARDRGALLNPDTGPFRPGIDQPGAYTGRGNTDQWGLAFAAMLEEIMQAAYSVIPAQYDPAARMAYPGGVTAQGTGSAEQFWLGLRAAFPSARFDIHHRIGMEEALMPPRAALRWSLSGRHEGWGPFGPPTGAEVHVMGISHAEFGPSGLRREWSLYDEAAVWMQIHAHTGLGATVPRYRDAAE